MLYSSTHRIASSVSKASKNGDLLHSEVKRVALRPAVGHAAVSGLEKGKHAAD